jgi:hypothetical protein
MPKRTPEELLKAWRKTYPGAYDDVPDDKLLKGILNTYPVYADQIEVPEPEVFEPLGPDYTPQEPPMQTPRVPLRPAVVQPAETAVPSATFVRQGQIEVPEPQSIQQLGIGRANLKPDTGMFQPDITTVESQPFDYVKPGSILDLSAKTIEGKGMVPIFA